MSIAFRKNKRTRFGFYSLTLLTFLILFEYACTNTHKKQHFFKKESITDAKDVVGKPDIIFYIPNSFLKYQVANLVLGNLPSIIDTGIYRYYDIAYSNSTATVKTFTISFVKKQPTLQLRKRSDFIRMYQQDNMMQKNISFNINGKKITLMTTDRAGANITLLNTDLSSLTVHISDPNMPYTRSGNTSIIFNNMSIVISVTTNTTGLQALATFMDGDARYQNHGISAVFPFAFMSDFSHQEKVYFKTGSSSFPDLLLEDIQLTNSGSAVQAKITVDNNSILPFPTDLTATASLDPQGNILRTINNYTYDPAGLSDEEIQEMDAYKISAMNYANGNVIGHTIVLGIDNDTLKFSSPGYSFSTIAGSDRVTYFQTNLISTIDLKK